MVTTEHFLVPKSRSPSQPVFRVQRVGPVTERHTGGSENRNSGEPPPVNLC